MLVLRKPRVSVDFGEPLRTNLPSTITIFIFLNVTIIFFEKAFKSTYSILKETTIKNSSLSLLLLTVFQVLYP